MAIIASWAGTGLAAGSFTAASVGTGDSTPTLHGTSASSLTVSSTGNRPPRVRHLQVASNPSAWYLDFTSQTASSGRAYFEIASGATLTTQTIIQINNGATRACSIYLTSTGVFRVYNQANVVIQSSAAGTIVAGTLYRIEWKITGGTSTTGSVECKLFAGESTTALATIGGTGLDVLTAHSRVYFGNTAATPTMPTHYWDDIAVGDSATYLGPATVTHDGAGTVAATSGTTGAATVIAAAAGAAPASSSTTGAATARLSGAGSTAATSGTSGAASVISGPVTHDGAGTVAATSSTAGAATVIHRGAGVVSASSGSTGAATARLVAAGELAAISEATGCASLLAMGAGSADAVSSTSGAGTTVRSGPVVDVRVDSVTFRGRTTSVTHRVRQTTVTPRTRSTTITGRP